MHSKSPRSRIMALAVLSLFSLGGRNCLAAVVSQALRIIHYDPPQSGPDGADSLVEPIIPRCSGWNEFLALQPDGKLKIVTGTVGSIFAWFTLSQGERLDAALVLGNPGWVTRGPHSIFYGDVFDPAPDGTWLLGWWTNDSTNYTPGPADCYGWMRLGVTGGKLAIVDDAATVRGAGIYAGTRIAVPEPSVMATFAGALSLLAARRRRN